MKNYFKLLQAFVLIGLLQSCSHSKDNRWQNISDKYQVKGTFVLKNLESGTTKIFNKKRSDSMFTPASTFKILNSMIALQTGAVKSVEDTLKWDGTNRGWYAWNKDHTMRTAIPVSCVWFYQELARRIGEKKMQKWVTKVQYGNQNTANNIDDFWLNGTLKISAVEQIRFIEKLFKNLLPFDKPIQNIVKEIIITDATKNYTVHSKTGWAQKIGWYVGYIETSKNTWAFALNMDMKDIKEAQLRKLITYQILKIEKIIE